MSGAASSTSFLRSGEIEPGLEIGLGVEAQDGDVVLLHAGHRRLEAVSLQAARLGLRGGDLAFPDAVLGFLAGQDTRRDHGRHRRRLDAAGLVLDDMNIVAADQHGSRALDALLAFDGAQPALGVSQAGEALQDHPIDLQRWRRWQQALLDEAGEALDERAGLALPARKVLGALRPHAGLRDDADAACAGAGGLAHDFASLANRRSGVKGRWAKRTPVAFANAFDTAGATGLMAHSPWDLAPSGPIASTVPARKRSVRGASAQAGMR